MCVSLAEWTHSVGDFRLVPTSHVVHERPSVAAHPAAGQHDPSMTTFPALHLMHLVAVQTEHSGKAVLHAVPTPSRSTKSSSQKSRIRSIVPLCLDATHTYHLR